MKDRSISSTSNSVGSVVSVLDPSRGGIGCSSCKWHSGIVFEERGLYDWNWTIYPYVRGTIVVLDRPTAASSLSSSSSSPSSTSTRPQTIFPISIPPPPFPLLSALSASQPPLRQSHLTPSKSAQQQHGRMISTSSSSPILNEEDEQEDRDDEERSSQPSILTSPSSSSVVSNSKRRRNKKKKGGETMANRLVDVASMSLLNNESIEVKTTTTSSSSFSSLIAQEQIVKETGEATTMMKTKEELMKKRGDEVPRELVSSLVVTKTSPIISQPRYRGPVVPWASISPDIDPSSFNAWGKFVFASMRGGAVVAGDVFSSHLGHVKTQI